MGDAVEASDDCVSVRDTAVNARRAGASEEELAVGKLAPGYAEDMADVAGCGHPEPARRGEMRHHDDENHRARAMPRDYIERLFLPPEARRNAIR